MRGNSSAVNDVALFGLLVMLAVGIAVSPDRSPRHRWLYWLGVPLVVTAAVALTAQRLRPGVVIGVMGLVILAICYGIRRLFGRSKPAPSGADRLVRAGLRLVIATVGAAVLAALSSLWLREGKYGHALTGVLGFLAMANLFASIKTSDEIGEMNVSADARGLTFTSPTLQRVLSATLQLLLGLALVSWGYLQVSGKLSWDDTSHYHGRRSRSSGGFMAFLVLVLGALGLFQTGYGLFKLYDLRNTAFLRVDPSGVRSVHGRLSDRFVAWDEIDRIPPGQPVRHTTRYTPSAYVYPRNGWRLSPPTSLGSSDNGFRLTNLMRFYWLNPRRRDELTDGDALRRLTAGRFEPGVEVEAERYGPPPPPEQTADARKNPNP